jgi:hypothetical protein
MGEAVSCFSQGVSPTETTEIRPEDRLVWGVEITKSTVDPVTGNVYVEGVANTGRRDEQDEQLVPEGIDYSYFLKKGHIKWEHHDRKGIVQPDQFVGEPLEARITPEGFFIKGMLYGKHKYTKKIVEQMETLEKSGASRRMGFSIEGGAVKRDPNDPGRVTKSIIRNVALTMNPVDSGAWARIAKSFDWTEDPLEFSLDTAGMAAIMPESLEGDGDPNAAYNDFARRVRLVVGRWLGGMHRAMGLKKAIETFTPERIATDLYLLADSPDVAEEAARYGYDRAVLLKSLAERLAGGELGMEDLAKSLDVSLDELLKSAEGDQSESQESGDKSGAGDEEWEPDEDEGAGEEADEDDESEKSFADDLIKSHADVPAALEVSDFLEALVTQLGDTVDGFSATLSKSLDTQKSFNISLAKSLGVVGQVVKGLVEENTTLKAQMTEVHDLLKSLTEAPTGRRAVVNTREIQTLRKSIGGQQDAQSGSGLTPAQISDKLVEAAVAGKIDSAEVTRYEVTGALSPQVASAIGISL